MARQTNINVNVNSTSAVKSINVLKQAFIELNKTVRDTVNNEGKIKIELDLKGFDISTLRTIDSTLRKIGKSIDSLTKSGNKYKKTGKQILDINTQLANNTKNVNDGLLSTVATFEFFRRGVTGVLKQYSQLSEATYGVGVAGQMNITQIEKLNSSFLELSTTVPSSAVELAKAVDDLIRTGRGYEESRQIIEQVARLSTASGDSLKDTAQVVTKVMVALNISGDRVKETLNTMHSTAIRTASDMGYLAESFKNVAGTASVLVSSSGLSGKELEDYKQKVLDLSMSLTGSMANLGISASSAGTKIKNLFSRLIAVEKSAKMLFDNAMKINNIKVDGDEIFTFDKLSELTRKDLPKAVELLSKWYTEGKLSTQVMQKMFTGRHFNEISNALIQINGDIDTFINSISKGVDYASDFDKNMFNITKQWELLNNNIKKIGQESFLGGGYTGALMLFNDILKQSNSTVTKTVGSITTLATTIGMTSLAVGALKATILPLLKGSILAGLSPISLALGGIAGLIYIIGDNLLDVRKTIADVNTNFDNTKLTTNGLLKDINTISGTIGTLKNNIQDMSKIDIVSQDTIYILNEIADKSSNLKETLESMSKIELLSSGEIKNLEVSLDNIIKNYNDKYSSLISKYKRDIGEEINKISKKGLLLGASADPKKIERLLKFYLDIQDIQPDVEKRMEALYKKAEELRIPKTSIHSLLGALDNSEVIKTGREELKKLSEEANKYATDGLTKFSEYQKRITEMQETTNKLSSVYNAYVSRLFKETGKITFDNIDYSGFEGVVEIFKQSNIQKIDSSIGNIKNRLISLNNESQELSKIKSTDELFSQAQKRIQEIERETKKLKNQEIELGKEKTKTKYIMEDIDNSMFAEFQYSDETAQLAVEILRTQLARNEAVQSGIISVDDENDSYTKMLDVLNALLKTESDKIVDQKNKTKYQIKYVNYLKESLDLELEEAKIGKTKGEQEALIYSYKLKQLELDKQIADKEIEVAKNSINNLKIEESLRKKLMSLKTGKEGQDFLDSFFEEHKSVLTGELGERDKNTYETIKVITNALVKSETAMEKIAIEPKKAIREFLEEIPNYIKDSLSAFEDMAEQGIIPFDNYGQKIVDRMSEDIIKNKEKVFKSFGILGEDLKVALSENISQINYVETLRDNDKGIQEYINKLKEKFKDNKEILEEIDYVDKKGTSSEKYALITKLTVAENKELLDIKKQILEKDKQEIENMKVKMEYLNSMGNLVSSIGDIFGVANFDKIGTALESVSKLHIKFEETGKIDWGNIFNEQEANRAFDKLLQGLNTGSSIGTAIGGITGGGVASQQGGALAGLIASGLNMTGWGAIGMAVGGSLLGGLFDESGNQEEAERRTKESNKLYNKNTEALQKLAQNMANLSGGVDSLNNTLISAVSKIPTVDSISNVTTAMTDMYKTMEKTRKFEDVAYQVTKTKKSKGFLGIGGGSTSWTETIELSVQDMLSRYGFEGALEDMTTQQIRDFSAWLEDYDLGDSDNFSILANALEDYAEGLDKFEKNIQNFLRDSTMEAFVGISSLEQESLRQQIEDFYKNLGFQIDEETSKQIDKLAEEMSVMVTIMSDVRGEFLNQWRETGMSAGSIFLKSMTPYIDAMLNNISQIYYDVYFSSVNESLEKEFKDLSEQLVELKKQGKDLDWSSVTDKLSGSFENVINSIIATKNQTASFNDVLIELQKKALETGLSLSEIFDLGLMSGTQKDVMSAFKDALLSSDSEGALTSVGELLGDKIGETMANKMIDNLMSDRILEFSAEIDKAMSGNLSFDSLAELSNKALSVGLMMENERQRLEAIRELFSVNSDIEYTTQNENIEYSSGVSQSVTNIYNLSSSVEAGSVIEADNVERLAEGLLDVILEKLRVDKGIVLG